MIKHTQEFTDIGGPIPGDCWRASIASLLDLPLIDVPHFLHEHPEEGYAWWYHSVQFVESAKPGWTLQAFDPSWPVYHDPGGDPPYVILTGQSPRGDWLHSVIADAETGDIVWDVHPDRTGVLSQVDVCALVKVGTDD